MTEIANVEQAAAWDGDEGEGWAAHEARHNEAVRAHTARLFEAAHVGSIDRVLDVGCGCGETTREAARRASRGDALGVDLSNRMIERARERSREEGLANVRFERTDAQVYAFPPVTLDLVISRNGAMFFADPVAAFTNIAGGTKAGGRMVLLAWQHLDRNEWLSALRGALAVGRGLPTPPAGAPGPFGLADPDQVRSILSASGFADVELDDVQAPFVFGTDIDDACAFASGTGVARGLLQDLDAADRARATDALRQTMADHDTGRGVIFDSRSWLISARRA
jgi:SAM-dependent methyltransferase